jgi:hypothetical protein
MSKSIFAFAAAILVSVPCAALADVYYPPAQVPLPSNARGHHPTLKQVFHWLDTNHDGYLTLDEFLAAPWITNKAQATQFFYWMDKNKDGLVSLQEFLAANKFYSGPSGYTVRTTYPWAWVYWRPWRYGWYWHNAGWRPGWNGGWSHSPRRGNGYAVAAHRRAVHAYHPAKHPGHAKAKHPHAAKHAKHPGKHAKTHKASHHGHAKGHGHHTSHGHGHR